MCRVASPARGVWTRLQMVVEGTAARSRNGGGDLSAPVRGQVGVAEAEARVSRVTLLLELVVSLKSLTNGQRQGLCAPKETWPPADDNTVMTRSTVVAVSYGPVRKARSQQTVDRLWVSAYPLHLHSLKGG